MKVLRFFLFPIVAYVLRANLVSMQKVKHAGRILLLNDLVSSINWVLTRATPLLSRLWRLDCI